jgi:hypothetical protein
MGSSKPSGSAVRDTELQSLDHDGSSEHDPKTAVADDTDMQRMGKAQELKVHFLCQP